VRNRLLLTPRQVAVTFPVLAVVTGTVVIVKVWEVAPGGIVTEAGTVATGLVDAILISHPPSRAMPLSTTLPVQTLQPGRT
jgi:hypothetical protein